MSDLVVVAFPSEAKAEDVRQKLLDLQSEYLIELEDAVIAIKQANGRVKLNQLLHPAAAGAAYGSLWGLIVGMIFLMPAVGAAVGAASGAIGGALTDVGIHDGFIREVAATLESGSAAVCADPQSDGRQSARAFERSGREGPADLVRPGARECAAWGDCRWGGQPQRIVSLR
jgi:uncharacterized membrane protein